MIFQKFNQVTCIYIFLYVCVENFRLDFSHIIFMNAWEFFRGSKRHVPKLWSRKTLFSNEKESFKLKNYHRWAFTIHVDTGQPNWSKGGLPKSSFNTLQIIRLVKRGGQKKAKKSVRMVCECTQRKWYKLLSSSASQDLALQLQIQKKS